ncbi:MAG TPA: hypothetical protein VEA37_05980 [Flavobacterium sp.]|nr:hypothetical protein [Flavobacterium sp.]
MFKIFLTPIIIVVLVAGGYYTVYKKKSKPTDNNDQPTVSTKTYKSDTRNFEFKYPNTFQFTAVTYANLDEKLVGLTLPQSAYPKTNFGDAAFYVSALTTKNINECLNIDLPENSRGFNTTKTINGATYYQNTGTGAAAGNLYESRYYRTFYNHACFEIGQTIHTTNIGNYATGAVAEVDKEPIWAQLDEILNSFKFK